MVEWVLGGRDPVSTYRVSETVFRDGSDVQIRPGVPGDFCHKVSSEMILHWEDRNPSEVLRRDYTGGKIRSGILVAGHSNGGSVAQIGPGPGPYAAASHVYPYFSVLSFEGGPRDALYNDPVRKQKQAKKSMKRREDTFLK